MTVTETPERWGVLEAQPVPSSLLDHADITEGIAWGQTVGLAESYNCLDVENEIPWPCPDEVLDAPADAPTVVPNTTGTLPAGTYYVAVATQTGNGVSTIGPVASATTTGTTGSLLVDFDEVDNASGYVIYAGTSADSLTAQTTTGTGTSRTITALTTTGPEPVETNGAVFRGNKLLSGPAWLEGFTFGTMGGLTCKPFGFSLEKGEAALRQAYELRESKGVERAFMRKAFAGADDLSLGEAVDVCTGLAILEGYAGSAYAGAPMLHVSRTIGSFLSQKHALERNGDKLFTRLDAPVAVGAGYEYPSIGPDGTPAPAGTQWIYATGEIRVARGDLIFSEAVDVRTNDFTVMGERLYLGVVDCFTAAIRVEIR